MDIHSVKIDLIHWLTELQDKSILEKLQVIKEQQEGTSNLTPAQKKELDDRLKKYESGNMNFSSWNTVKDRIRKRGMDDL
ncbi:addiction module protein [Mangrovivirga cuniculi]|uniref:Addiction module component n=1 Tax=Mangrovivirga cuniculi TaxID=2715131 RepID=A0A4D7JNW5_9BACT|nr:addiction module protein [Mangrovivirga cuniculi]QCK14482.1 addiction module component [Mangrovivirga cuniculi]